MMLQDGGRSWVANYDAFRSVPKELAEATVTGAAMTVCGALTCVVLFICEVSAFLTTSSQTRVLIDSNQDAQMRINFDVHMLDIMCEHVTVGVWDAFGTDRMNITTNVQKQRIDHTGARKGHPYTEDELAELEFGDQTFTKEELAELDSDWSSSSDDFKHNDFQAVIDAHDATFVYFYADWCSHCRNFLPIWATVEDNVNGGNSTFSDADGAKANVRLVKINCVDFEETCADQRIQTFPHAVLYRRGTGVPGGSTSSVVFHGKRTQEALEAFLQKEVGKRHLHTGVGFHEIFNEGCRLSGHLDVARVPGTLHFQAVHSKDKNLNLAFTNVSHYVHHFSFGEAPRRSIYALPAEYKRHVNPIDGKTFVSPKFHLAPQHYIKVVHTRFQALGIRSYQQTHQWSVRTLQRKTVPQAKFSYDLSPVEVLVTKSERRWYDFVTHIFAIIGGAFSVTSMLHSVLKVSGSQIKAIVKSMM